MADERRDVYFPMWRKKVDGSLFTHSMTAIPKWVCDNVWHITESFVGVRGKSDERSRVKISLKHDSKTKEYNGWVTISESTYKGKPKISTRLEFEKQLSMKLQEIFVMSHMRDLERRMRKDCQPKEIEKEIPFYEFLDIEWNNSERLFIFKPHYRQETTFPELFKHLRSKHIFNKIEDDVGKVSKKKISKGDWKERNNISKEITTENVIYTLIDIQKHEIYVGEARNLAKRFRSERHEIPGWTHYRVDKLPDDFDDEMRINLERMMIRFTAALIKNSEGVDSMEIADYNLNNKRVDK